MFLLHIAVRSHCFCHSLSLSVFYLQNRYSHTLQGSVHQSAEIMSAKHSMLCSTNDMYSQTMTVPALMILLGFWHRPLRHAALACIPLFQSCYQLQHFIHLHWDARLCHRRLDMHSPFSPKRSESTWYGDHENVEMRTHSWKVSNKERNQIVHNVNHGRSSCKLKSPLQVKMISSGRKAKSELD